MKYGTIFDISLPLVSGMITYPGNPDFQKDFVSDLECGASSTVSRVILGSHSGTHIDAPLHSIKGGVTIDAVPLNHFFGPCKVFDATAEVESVSLEFVKTKEIGSGDRILFKTKNSLIGFEHWRDDFIFISSEASEYLASKEITLIGIDFLSIKKKGSIDNRPHTEFLSRGISILEGIDLSKVSEGEYVLSALPLKIIDGDGAPTRAILIEL
jgi:arylformamidase